MENLEITSVLDWMQYYNIVIDEFLVRICDVNIQLNLFNSSKFCLNYVIFIIQSLNELF